jgi:nicotinate-nucleotide adenylyltransferase
MRYLLPYATSRQTIGLLGGSFDPAHEGHVHITKEAIKRFKLDSVWWLVTSKNPLKRTDPKPLQERVNLARSLIEHPKVTVTCLEKRLETEYTVDTIARLKGLYPEVSFVWLMGADNLSQFQSWKSWKEIVKQVPLGIIARPGNNRLAEHSVLMANYRANRLPSNMGGLLGRITPPSWCYLSTPLNNASSSQIRARNE